MTDEGSNFGEEGVIRSSSSGTQSHGSDISADISEYDEEKHTQKDDGPVWASA